MTTRIPGVDYEILPEEDGPDPESLNSERCCLESPDPKSPRPEGRYSKGSHPEGPYPKGRYSESSYPEGPHPEGPYSKSPCTEDPEFDEGGFEGYVVDKDLPVIGKKETEVTGSTGPPVFPEFQILPQFVESRSWYLQYFRQ